MSSNAANTIAPFTARTTSGRLLHLNLRLHPHTASKDHVGDLLERILDAVSGVVEREGDVGDGDVIQALTLAAAVRLRVAGVPAPTAAQLLTELSELAAVSAAEVTADTASGSGPQRRSH